MDSEMVLETAELVQIMDTLPPAPDALLRRYAPLEKQFDGRYITFDRIKRKRRVAPFVSPVVTGKVMERVGRAMEAFEPAYIKDKRVIEPGESVIRAVGERIGGDRSGQDRVAEAIAIELKDMRDAWVRRLEIMTMQVVKEGKVTVVGDQYPQVVVDFKRKAACKIANLTTTAAWSNAAATPLKNLRDWGVLSLKEGEAAATDVIMGVEAFGKFVSHASVGDRFKAAQPTNITLLPTVPTSEGLTFQGTCEGLNIFTYTGWFEDPTNGNTLTEIWPADGVAVTSPALQCVRAFGGIKDGKAGYKAMPYFPKMWENEDPADVYLMGQSAPLIIPSNVDAAVVCLDIDA